MLALGRLAIEILVSIRLISFYALANASSGEISFCLKPIHEQWNKPYYSEKSNITREKEDRTSAGMRCIYANKYARGCKLFR